MMSKQKPAYQWQSGKCLGGHFQPFVSLHPTSIALPILLVCCAHDKRRRINVLWIEGQEWDCACWLWPSHVYPSFSKGAQNSHRKHVSCDSTATKWGSLYLGHIIQFSWSALSSIQCVVCIKQAKETMFPFVKFFLASHCQCWLHEILAYPAFSGRHMEKGVGSSSNTPWPYLVSVRGAAQFQNIYIECLVQR